VAAVTWIWEVFVADDSLRRITTDVPSPREPSGLVDRLRHGSLRDRKKAVAVLATLKGIRVRTVAACLNLSTRTVVSYASAFAEGGFQQRPDHVQAGIAGIQQLLD
jgi:hypothetical protein